MNSEVFSNIPKPIVLLIFDGFGIAPSWGGNAISNAKMTNYYRFLREMPHTEIAASGEEVGLPDSEEGNSEVGHLNIGAGIAVEQDIKRINKQIESGQFFKNALMLKGLKEARLANKTVHLMGILSHGVVHGELDHLKALLKLCKQEDIKDVAIHLFTDGRDCPPFQSLNFLQELQLAIDQVGIGKISSIIGRYYAMDRDKRWERTQKAYDLLTLGSGTVVNTAQAAISRAYRDGFSDEFIPAFAVRSGDGNYTIDDGDLVIFYNYRGDRARQITAALSEPDFNAFARRKAVKNINMITFTSYKDRMPVNVAFPHDKIEWPLSHVLAHYNKKQLHIAETEKYAHVTYFFNGGQEQPFADEQFKLIPSAKVATYDQKPEMSAEEITTALLEAIASEKYDFIIVNYANPDMVAHTGNIEATITALNLLDKKLGEIEKAVLAKDGVILFTADHGNCEQMINASTGEISTDHTNNKVPFIVIGNERYNDLKLRMGGALRDIAPTILDIMQLQQPTQMTGRSLIDKYLV